MDRRTFLKAAGSFAVLLPWMGQKAFAQSPRYQGPVLICINASGGWDTTMFFDPKGPYVDRRGADAIANKAYEQPATLTPFSYAPVTFTQSSAAGPVELHSPEEFLTKYGRRLLLVNGLDTETNAHPVGEQIVWSGHIASEYPSISALLAAQASQSMDLPCAYLAGGGYTRTLGLVPPTQATLANVRSIAYEGYFHGTAPSSPTSAPNLFTPETSQRIREANAQRIAQLNQQLILPESKGALGRYDKALLAQSGLEPLADKLASTAITIDRLKTGASNTTGINTALQQADLALYGFSLGIAVSASISFAGFGFDTHNANDSGQQLRLGHLFILIERILTQAEEMGLSNRLYVVVGSEFARSPFYNTDNGKDHWNATSLMVFGPEGKIRGGRVVGATESDLYPAYVNPANPTERLSVNSGGMVIKPRHVHRELRRVLGLLGTPLEAAYGLIDYDKAIPLF
ncbi:MAG: DUF1501 domain-containing protein [Cystobacterineae bacterium]|nr:DUF1501 domain-containing protein [Cystobacterineae bacterium]